MKKTLGRSLGALVTACAVVFAMAGPASAVSMTATINSGAITVSKAGQTTQNITIGGGTCPSGTLTADITSTTTGTVAVTAASSTSEFLWNSTTYVSVLTLRTGGTAGSYDHSTGAMTGLVVPLQARLYTKASACTAGTLLCTWNTNLTLSSSNFTSHAATSTATLSGTGTALALGGACSAPFTTYTGGAVAVSALAVTLT